MACDPQILVTAASCFSCQPVAVQIAILIRLACAIRDGETVACDPQSLINDANCILQCVPQGMTLAALIPVFCDIANGGGGGGGVSCVLCGTGADPVAAPGTCTCAVYFRTDNGSFFYWDDGTATWVTLIAA